MTGFGEPLKRAREAKGVTIDSVAESTRIARRYLQALERSELEALPGKVFDRGYIKAYAQYLEIDPEPVLAAYADEAGRKGNSTPESDRLLEEMHDLLDRRRPERGRLSALFKTIAYAVPVVVAAAGLAWLSFRRPAPPPEPKPEERVVLQRPPEPAPPPVPAPTVPPKTETPPPRDGLRITQSGVGTALRDRNLAGQGTRFVEGTRLLYWTRVLGGESGDRVVHVWIHDGATSMRAELPLGGPHWRTYSTLTLPTGAAGEWVVEARAPDGRVLSRDEFLCVASDSDVDEDLEPSVQHALHVEGHRLRVHPRQPRVLHDPGVDAVAVRP
jgi:transcriptional regulator with XRE-family HTH domain